MEHLKSDATFLRRNNLSAADVKIGGTIWELKSSIGNGKHTIQNNLREASHQSQNIVIDLRRCKLPSDRAISRIRYEANHAKSIKKTPRHHQRIKSHWHKIRRVV